MNVVLVPKKNTLENVADLKPILLTNFDGIVYKAMPNGLKKFYQRLYQNR